MPARELIERLLALAEMAVWEVLELDYGDPEDRYIYRELQELKTLAAALPSTGIDLTNPAVRDSFDSMLEAAATHLPPAELVRWHHRIQGCSDLSEAAEMTAATIGRPMSDADRRIADEVRLALGAG